MVLRAEGLQPVCLQHPVQLSGVGSANPEDFYLIEDYGETAPDASGITSAPPITPLPATNQYAPRPIGTTEITQGNIDNDHLYLRSFFERFPADAVGGSNRASAAQREIAVDWGAGTVVMTDLDGVKRSFRKRGWIREFFERNGARAGDMVSVEETAPYSYRVAFQRCPR